jgi:type IX secretion system substrate protein
LYVAGYFDTIAGEPRTSLAALDATTGALAPWDPHAVKSPDASVGPPRMYAIAALGHDIFVGGDFAGLGGAQRTGLAAVDDSVGNATGWDPAADEIVWSLCTSGPTLFVGGKFRTIGGLPAASLAEVTFPPPAAPPPPALTLAQNAPNPARTTAIIHFALPAPAPVTLEVYDVQGRRVATLLDHQLHTAGGHDFLVRADHWEPGVYFYRVEAAGRSATRKMVVLQ